MEFKEMENYIKKTHNKFFFVFKEKELKELEEKIGMELEWTPVKLKTGLSKDMEKNFLIIDFEHWHFAEIEKNDKNIILLEKKLGAIPSEKDCFCSQGLYDDRIINRGEVKTKK